MADIRPLYCVFPQVEPYAADDLDDGEKFLDGAITRRKVKSKLPSMYLRYGFLMSENLPPNATSEKQNLDRSPRVVGGEEDENGDRVFEICFSQDNCNYLIQLAFSPKEEADDEDEDSHQEEEGDQLRSDYDSHDGEETYEDYNNDNMEETDEDYEIEEEKETYEDERSHRVFELYFSQEDRHYIVRLVFFREEGLRFLEEDDEFLFVGLQRLAGLSYEEEEEEDEVPAIDNKSSSVLPEVESEISRRLMEAKIGEPDDIRTTEDGEKQSRIEYPEAAKGSKNEIDTFIDPLMILERQNHLKAQIMVDHLHLHSAA